MKRFILIALACILPSFNNAFAAANMVPVTELERRIDQFCCGHSFDEHKLDKTKVAHYDDKQKKWVVGPSRESAAFNLPIEGYYKRVYNETPDWVQQQINNGADIHVTVNIRDASGNPLKTGTLIDMIDHMVRTRPLCSDKKDIRDGITMATLNTPEYCNAIKDMLIAAWPKNPNDTNTSASKPESKPASQPNNNADVDDGPIIETTLQAEQEPATVAAQQKPAEEKPVEKPAKCTKEELAELHATDAVRMLDDGKCSPTKCDDKNGYVLIDNECVQEKTSITTITWVHCNGSSQVTTHSFKQYEPGKNLTKFDNTPGYTFMGWFYDENYTNLASHKKEIGEINKSLVPIQNPKTDTDIVLYAKCEPIQYKITYDCGKDPKATGCDTCTPTSYTIETAREIELTCATLERPGYTFAGWTDEPGGKSFTTLVINQDNPRNIKLYADWRSDNAITVHGKIVDKANNEPLGGVSVTVVDHEGGDAIKDGNGHRLVGRTDDNGEFTLHDVPETAKIKVYTEQYKQTYQQVKKDMNIELTPKSIIGQDTLIERAGEFKSKPCGGPDDPNHIQQGHTALTKTAQEQIQLLEEQFTGDNKLNRNEIANEIVAIRDNKDNIICIPDKCVEGYGNEDGTPNRNEKTGMMECLEQPAPAPTASHGAAVEYVVLPSKIPPVFNDLDSIVIRSFSGKGNKWVDSQGKFNTARLASDSIAATVLGTVGGVVTSTVMKKNQVKKGFEDMKCTVGGQSVASYGDEFRVGLVPMPTKAVIK